MPKTFVELKKAIRRAPKNADGRRRFRGTLRDQVVEAALAAKQDGQSITEIAKQVGLTDQLLGTWLRRASTASPLRPVEVVADKSSERSPLRLVLPSGAVIEGLSLEDIEALLRAAP